MQHITMASNQPERDKLDMLTFIKTEVLLAAAAPGNHSATATDDAPINTGRPPSPSSPWRRSASNR